MEPFEGQIIEERDIIDVTPEQQPEQEECKSCKQKGFTTGQIIMLTSAFYVLFSSIYGTIKIIKEIMTYF